MDRILSTYPKNESEMEHFFDDFGGEEKAKKEYPAIYEAVQKTKKADKNEDKNEMQDDMKDKGFVIGAIVMDKGGNSKKDAVGADEGVLKCDSMGTVSDAAMITVNTEMIDLTTSSMLDAESLAHEGTDLSACVSQGVSEIGNFNDHKIEVKSRFYYVKEDGTCGIKTMKTANHTVSAGDSLIQEILVDAPAIKAENVSTNKHVNIVYDRTPKNNEKADISYDANEIEIQGDLVKTLIPVNGHFTLAKTMEPIGLTSVVGLSLIYKEKTVVLYTYANLAELDGYFSYKKDQTTGCYTVQFKFDEDWRSYIHKSWYTDGTYITDCQLRWSFRYSCYLLDAKGNHVKDEDGEDVIEELGICINSEATKGSQDKFNHSEGKSKVVIPYIYIQWGCFHKDTKILMADGLEKKACEIKIGDKVMSREGKPVPVEQIYEGEEDTLYCIETESGRTIKVTETHQILTEDGLFKAKNLTVGATVILKDGTDQIANVYTEEYKDIVYSLDCGGAILIADGIAAGDFVCQNPEGTEPEKKEHSKEVKEIMEEFKRFSEEFNRKNNSLLK